jgi:hypothetical protein
LRHQSASLPPSFAERFAACPFDNGGAKKEALEGERAPTSFAISLNKHFVLRLAGMVAGTAPEQRAQTGGQALHEAGDLAYGRDHGVMD